MDEKYYSQIEDVYLPSNNYVLVLPGWYPTWQDPFMGDFNQRHVKAAGLQTPQVVLYVVKDQLGTLAKTETRYKQKTENVVEITVMYPAKKNKGIDLIHSNLLFVKLLFQYADIIRKKWGKPLLLHSYIVIRGGLAGLLLGKKWKLPFILSENWTIYYPADPGYLFNRNFLFNRVVRSVFKNAKRFLPVTNNLKQQVDSLFGAVPSTIVPNVVETELFSLANSEPDQTGFRLIHVSTMTYQKNPEGLLRSFKKFNEQYEQTSLLMVGPYPKEVLQYATKIGLHEQLVQFTGPVSYEKVAEYLKASKALVLFSRYENLPCVILEALCCGLPVISTSVGGIPEVINTYNGILVDSEDEQQLTGALCHAYTNYTKYNRRKISESAQELYSYASVGNLINAVYRNINSPT